jgi:hypothetical protein
MHNQARSGVRVDPRQPLATVGPWTRTPSTTALIIAARSARWLGWAKVWSCERHADELIAARRLFEEHFAG